MKSILKYRGGKSTEIKYFRDYIPNFRTYYEPFFGGGAVYFYLEPEHAVINDINTRLMDFYRDVREEYELTHIQLTRLGEEYKANRLLFDREKRLHPTKRVLDKNELVYYRMRDYFNGRRPTDLTYATVYFYINKTAYSGMIRYNKNGDFNVPYGRYKNFNTDLLTSDHARLLKNSTLLNGDYTHSFELATHEDFMFLDPPYDTVFSDYGNEVFTGDFDEDDHRRLAQDFRNLACRALMVIGETELTRELYNGYIRDRYNKNYSVNIRNRFKSSANHLIITNY
nr:Dam family site-specific DNA-(adenine-N6)-methyltransferase [Limosilactobacillus mucosae]